MSELFIARETLYECAATDDVKKTVQEVHF